MPTPTFTLIASSTVGSGGASFIDFSSIPSTYTDLVLYISARSARTTGGTDTMRVEINNSTTNFTFRALEGDGATAYSTSGSTGFIGNLPQEAGSTGWTANTFCSNFLYFPNYAGSTNKSFSTDATTENNSTTSYADLIASLWSQTTAINQLTLKSGNAANFVQYSSAYLYGIVKS
jgi:hypothetical protein